MIPEKKLIILTTKLPSTFICFSRIRLSVNLCFNQASTQCWWVFYFVKCTNIMQFIFDLFLIACSLMRDIFQLNASVWTAIQTLARKILQSNLHQFLSFRWCFKYNLHHLQLSKVKSKVCIRANVAHQAGAYPGFRSMKRLGVFLLPPGWDASPSQGYPPALSLPVPIYTPGWREAPWE